MRDHTGALRGSAGASRANRGPRGAGDARIVSGRSQGESGARALRPEDVPAATMNAGRDALVRHLRALPRNTLPTFEDQVRAVLAAAWPEIRKAILAELFGTPEEIRAREAEAAKRKPDDIAELCERARPGHHERQIRERAAQGILEDFPVSSDPADEEDETILAIVRWLRGQCTQCGNPINGEPCGFLHAALAKQDRGEL